MKDENIEASCLETKGVCHNFIPILGFLSKSISGISGISFQKFISVLENTCKSYHKSQKLF